MIAFDIFETDLMVDPEKPYEEAARKVFADRPEMAISCYGHIHRPETTEVDGSGDSETT